MVPESFWKQFNVMQLSRTYPMPVEDTEYMGTIVVSILWALVATQSSININ